MKQVKGNFSLVHLILNFESGEVFPLPPGPHQAKLITA